MILAFWYLFFTFFTRVGVMHNDGSSSATQAEKENMFSSLQNFVLIYRCLHLNFMGRNLCKCLPHQVKNVFCTDGFSGIEIFMSVYKIAC